MKEIARACGFEAGNIYNYFRSKEAILYEILYEEVDRVLSLIKYLEDDEITSPVEQLRSLIKHHVGFMLVYRSPKGLLFDLELRSLSPANQKKIIELRDNYDRILSNIIRRGIDTGDFANVDYKLASYSIAAMLIRTRIWFSRSGRLSANEIADFIFEFSLNGLRNIGKEV